MTTTDDKGARTRWSPEVPCPACESTTSCTCDPTVIEARAEVEAMRADKGAPRGWTQASDDELNDAIEDVEALAEAISRCNEPGGRNRLITCLLRYVHGDETAERYAAALSTPPEPSGGDHLRRVAAVLDVIGPGSDARIPPQPSTKPRCEVCNDMKRGFDVRKQTQVDCPACVAQPVEQVKEGPTS